MINNLTMSSQIQIRTKGIKNVLRKYDYCQAIAEFIWNGFDAKANKVEIKYEANEIGAIQKIEIKDNGYGIQQELLRQKFTPFYETEKAIEISSPKNHSITHGKNGFGRLTFFKFASQATWRTIYEKDGVSFEHKILIKADSLERFTEPNEPVALEHKTQSGTTVEFEGIQTITKDHFDNEILDFLRREFGWFLELNKEKGYSIKINQIDLDYLKIIGESDEKVVTHNETKTTFKIRYVRWNESLNQEYSRYYFLDSKGEEKWKEHTTLNQKGDHFYHSLYVTSEYFNDFNFDPENPSQKALIGGQRSDEQFKYLMSELSNFLRLKRKPFLKEYSDKLINDYETQGVFPNFKNDEWDKVRKNELESVVRGLYEVQPKIFSNLNIEQKKTFVGLLNLLLDSDDRENILEIIKGVVDLEEEDRKQLAELLKHTRLSRIISTIKLIGDRYKVIEGLRELVFNESLKATERDHIQKVIEEHYWIFGEQYNLVTAAEQKFEEALRRYTYILRGEDKKKKIDHPDKNKEMDIFMCRQNKQIDTIENIVVELKAPKVKLGEKELSQVKRYMRVVLSEPEFNAENMIWNFYLVGNEFDTSGCITSEINNAKSHGEKFLVFKDDKYKIYVKKWSEIFTEFECKHKFLNDKLQLEKGKIIEEFKTAEEVVDASKKSSATIRISN